MTRFCRSSPRSPVHTLFVPAALVGAVWSSSSPAWAARRHVTPDGARVLGYINATAPEYGAVPNDSQDDTEAIQKAISDALVGGPRSGSVVYLPDGVYNISDEIRAVNTMGEWAGSMVVQGQSRERTVLKLKDSATAFQNPEEPRAILQTGGSKGSATLAGNSLLNAVYDLTLDVGSGNLGAIGIRFNVSNCGALDNVLVKSSDPQGAGVVGIDQSQPWPGPGIVRNVEVQGFNTGVRLSWAQKSMVYEHLTLRNQRVAGFLLDDNAASIRDLRSFQSSSDVPAVKISGERAMLTLVGAQLRGNGDANAGTYAIENDQSHFFLRDISSRGYRGALRSRGQVLAPGRSIDEIASESAKTLFSSARGRSLQLPIRETPSFWNTSPKNWAVVTDYGATPNDETDDTLAIQKALDSGRTTVVFPTGAYRISETLRVRGKLRHIFGNATLEPFASNGWGDRTQPRAVVRFETPSLLVDEVIWERLDLSAFVSQPGAIVFEHASRRGVALKDAQARGGFLLFRNSRTPEGALPGQLFVENVSGQGGPSNKWRLVVPQQAWMRQVNTEDVPGSGTYIANLGGTLWILGHTTQGPNVAVETRVRGRSEVLGGFYLTGTPFPRLMPAIINHESTVSASYVHEALSETDRYPVQVRETRGGVTRELKREDVTPRLHTQNAEISDPGVSHETAPLGAFVPLYSGGR